MLQSKIKTFFHILSWLYTKRPIISFQNVRDFLSFNDQNFDKIYYQSEHPYLNGLHPYIHYIEKGRDQGAFKYSPKPHYLADKLGEPRFPKELLLLALTWKAPTEVKSPEARHCDFDKYAHISIIMPYYNRADSVVEAVHSVVEQTWRSWRLYIIDDGSEDDGLSKVKAQYEDLIDQGVIVLISSPHQGAAAARNLGLIAAQGSWIAYLDSDNLWKPDHLSMHMQALETSGAMWSYGDVTKPVTGLVSTGAYSRFRLLQENYIDINNMVHHRKLFETLGGFDTRLRRLIDYDLILRFGRHYAPVKLNQSTVIYTLRSDSITRIQALLPARARVRLNHICERISVGLERPCLFLPISMAHLTDDLHKAGLKTSIYNPLEGLPKEHNLKEHASSVVLIACKNSIVNHLPPYPSSSVVIFVAEESMSTLDANANLLMARDAGLHCAIYLCADTTPISFADKSLCFTPVKSHGIVTRIK